MGEYKKLIQKTLALFMSVSLVSANFSTSVLAEEETNEDAVQTEEPQEEVMEETVISEEEEQPETGETAVTEEEEAPAEEQIVFDAEEEPAEQVAEAEEEKETAEEVIPEKEEETEVIEASEEQKEEELNAEPDAEGKYELWVANIRVTETNKNDILGDKGQASFNPENDTLTISGTYTNTDEFGFIVSHGIDLTIVSDNLTVTGSTPAVKMEIGSVTFEGNFNFTADEEAIEAYSGNTTFKSGSFVIKSTGRFGVGSENINIGNGVSLLDVTGGSNAWQALYYKYQLNYSDNRFNITKEPGAGDYNQERHVVFKVKDYFEVNYDGNGAAGSVMGETVEADIETNLPDHSYEVPEDKEFAGWKSSIDGKVYAAGTPVKITEDCTFTAEWKMKYILEVGGVTVGPENKNDIFGLGTVKFDSTTNTLYVTDASIDFPEDEEHNAVKAEGFDLTISAGHLSSSTAKSSIVVTNGSLTLDGDIDIASIAGPCVKVTGGGITFKKGEFEFTAPDGGCISATGPVKVLGDCTLFDMDGGDSKAVSSEVDYDHETLFVAEPESDEQIPDANHVVIRPKAEFTVSFDAGTGSGTMESATAKNYEKYELPECQFKEPSFGKFAGWQAEDGKVYQEKDLVKITGDCKFTATWEMAHKLEVAGIPVTFENKGNVFGDNTVKFDTETRTLTISGSYSIDGDKDLITADGFDLTVVSDSNGLSITKAKTGISMTNGSLTLDGRFYMSTTGECITVRDGNVTFRGGSYTLRSPDNCVYASKIIRILGDVSTLDAETEDYQAFGSPYSPEYDLEKLIYTADPEDKGLWAKHVVFKQKPHFEVSFDANGGSGTMENMKVFEGQEFILPEHKFTEPEDMVFDCWKGSDGKEYEAGKPAEITSDTTFTAQWKVKYNLKVRGVTVDPSNKNNITGDGKVHFDSSTNTLTMDKHATINAEGIDESVPLIEADGLDLTIVGDYVNLLDSATAVRVNNGNLTVEGNLVISTKQTCIEVNGGNVTFRNGFFTMRSDLVGCVSATGTVSILGDVIKFSATRGSKPVMAVSPVPEYDHERLYLNQPGSDDELSGCRQIILEKRYVFSVSFEGNGAEGTMEDMEAYDGVEFKLPDYAYTEPEDMVFTGWKASDGTVYEAGQGVFLTDDCTFTAQWQLKYDLKVGGVAVDASNKNDILGGGTAVFNSETNTLTMNGDFSGEGLNDVGFVEAKNFNLRVEGNASITIDDTSKLTTGIYVTDGTVTLAGDFNITSTSRGIYGYGIVLESGSLYAKTTGEKGIPIGSHMGSLTISDNVRRVEADSVFDAMSADNYYISELLSVELPENGKIDGGRVLDESGTEVQHFVLTQKEQTEPVFSGHRLVLSGSLGLKFGVKFPENFNSDGSYMTFTVNGKEQKIFTDDAEDGTEGKKVYTCSLNVLQMAEKIEAVFHYGDNQTISQTYTLAKYFQYFDDHKADYSEKTLNLVHAVANYGYYAQPYLTDLNGLEGKYAKIYTHYDVDFNYDSIIEEVKGYAFAKATSDSKVSAASYKLSLDSDTALSVMVKVPEGTAVDMSASFDGKTYKDVTKQNSTTYVIKITGIKATHLGDTITVTGNAGGNFTITVSALSYVRSILEGGDKYSEDARKTVAALYQYYKAVMNQ